MSKPEEENKPKGIGTGSEVENLLFLLHSETGKDVFHIYLTKQYTEHHLTFWYEVEKYKKLTGAEREAHATHMYDHFVKVGTKNQVNIYTPLRNKIQEFHEKKEYPDDLFDAAQKVVWDMFKGNFYRSFLNTPEYAQWKESEEEKMAEAEKKKSSMCTIL